MGKTKKQHEKDIVEVIKEKKVMCIQHIFGHYADLASSQFYNLKLQESESIKEAIVKNKSKATGYLINKWIASDNPTLQIAAYRLTCTDEERQKLNQNYLELTGKDGKDLAPARTLTPEEIKQYVQEWQVKY